MAIFLLIWAPPFPTQWVQGPGCAGVPYPTSWVPIRPWRMAPTIPGACALRALFVVLTSEVDLIGTPLRFATTKMPPL
jgi:hypothetical protein